MQNEFSSLWSATAEEPVDIGPMEGNIETDIAVVGGGYAGLSTALHLAESREEVTVLEAHAVGWGASGRSGGQVIPGLKHDPDALCKRMGAEAGEKLATVFGGTADYVFNLISRYGIRCQAIQAGWIQPAHSDAAETVARNRCQQWLERGADVAMLSASEVAERLGTDVYKGGWIDRRGGSVQPLSYTRGLARAAISKGASIYDRSKVVKLHRDGDGWRLVTDGGFSVQARRVVLCTNGYTDDLWPGLRKTVVAANSFQIATRPLPDALGKTILRDGVVASDTRRLLTYWRRDDEGRFLLGGRGTFHAPKSTKDFRHLDRMLTNIYPQLADIPVAYRWAGRIAMTRDFWPHIHEPARGLLAVIGCQGRGIALQTFIGSRIAKYLGTGRVEKLPIPITPVKQIPVHALRRLYMGAAIAYYKLRDVSR